MKYIFFVLLLLSFARVAQAETRGIGVSPAIIDVQGVSSWPYRTEMFVKNGSLKRESFEITFKSNSLKNISIEPSRFSLKGGETRRVLVQLEKPDIRIAQGTVRVTALRITPEGFATGTGIEIPVRVIGALIVQDSDASELLGAGIAAFTEMLWPSPWIVLFAVIIIFFVLRAVTFFIYPFFFPGT